MTAATRLLVAALAGASTGVGLWCAARSLRPPTPRPVRPPARRRIDTGVLVAAVAVAMIVLFVTRWPVVAGAAGLLVIGWRQLFAGATATRDRRRLDGIAKWLEDLRDLQHGSNLDLIETLTQAASRAPKVIEPELVRFAGRVAHHVPLPEALLTLADELDHPVADTAVAAMVFAAGHASGSALHETFAQLAAAARDELTARDRIDRMRQNFERAMRRMLIILAVLIAYMALVTKETLEPYQTPVGQLWLVVPCGIWAGSLIWLRRLSRYQRTARHLSRPAITEAALR